MNLLLALITLISTSWCMESQDWEENLAHSRVKRLIWMTEEKRLVLPPGTQLVLTPTLAMPFLRYPPTGVDANITISTPFTSKYFPFVVKIKIS